MMKVYYFHPHWKEWVPYYCTDLTAFKWYIDYCYKVAFL